MASSSLSMKLLVDTKREKVLFAEASKAVVDFLFTLLQLPLGAVVKLLTKKHVVGCLGNLYSSVQNLDPTYMQPNDLLPDSTNNNNTAYYEEPDIPRFPCSCECCPVHNPRSTTTPRSGFVKEVVTYMVMDDLVIISLLNHFNVQDLAVLKEMHVHLGVTEGLKVLKESMESEMVLTNDV
nr:uncharacterized protein LOC112779123 [Arachis hypogaea]